MSSPAHNPLSSLPALLGFALRPLPLLPLQLAMQSLVDVICVRHPELGERLESFATRRVGIAPADLPFAMVLEPRGGVIELALVRTLENETTAARIHGPFLALLGLVDGTYDGDALFFSRDLAIEGDLEVVLALRNAIDDAEIKLGAEMVACLGSFPSAASAVVRATLASCTEALVRHRAARQGR